jgi:hypothetical protein
MCIKGVWHFLVMFYHVSTSYVELHDVMVLKQLVVVGRFLGYLMEILKQHVLYSVELYNGCEWWIEKVLILFKNVVNGYVWRV